MEQIVDGAARDFAAGQRFGPKEYFVYFEGQICGIASKDPQNRQRAVQETCPRKKGAGRISHSPRYSSRFAYER